MMQSTSAPARSAARRAGAADRWINYAAATTVAGLAGIAGALSYSHMRQLAQGHGQVGWHAHAFPLSVDGVEIVASLVLLADRRAGRRSGLLPWAALAAGTTGSLAANIATAHPDLVSRIIAGWPAVALLVAVKLLSRILEHRVAADGPATAIPESAARATGQEMVGQSTDPPPASPFPDPKRKEQIGTGNSKAQRHDAVSSAPISDSAGGQTVHPPSLVVTVPSVVSEIEKLLPAARAAKSELDRAGRPLTRDALAAGIRHRGHPVRNAAVTSLLRRLREEQQQPAA